MVAVRSLARSPLSAATLTPLSAYSLQNCQPASYLQDKGLSLRQGTIVDATIIHAPSSTKNKDGKRAPEMHQTKKGNQYFFGMKAHIGADVESGLVHHVHGTAANVADVTQVAELLHGEENGYMPMPAIPVWKSGMNMLIVL